MRSFVALGVVSLVAFAGMAACGDDDDPNVGVGGSNTGGRAGSAGAGGASGGAGGVAGGAGGRAGAGGGGGAGGAALPPVPTANCTGCVQLTVSNNSATFPTGAVMNQAGYIFVAGATEAPFNLDEVDSITWRVQALTPNAAYFVQPFLQTTPPEDPAYGGVFPPPIPLAPAQFAAGAWVDVVMDVASINRVFTDAGPDSGIEVNTDVDAGDAGVTLTGFDKTYTRFVGLNVGAQPTAPLGWVSVEVDSVTVQGTSNFPEKTFTAGVEGLTLNAYQVPTGTLAPAAR